MEDDLEDVLVDEGDELEDHRDGVVGSQAIGDPLGDQRGLT